MNFLLSFLLLVASAFTVLALPSMNATIATSYDYDTWHYHGYSTAEVWIGRTAINVGDMIGYKLYSRMLAELTKDCGPERTDMSCAYKGVRHYIETTYVKDLAKGDVGVSYFSFIAEGKWESEDHRKVLVLAVAKAMEYLTTGPENCYGVPNNGIFCNMGNFVRVNLPASPGKSNHMWVELFGNRVTKEFRCCQTRKRVDNALDSMRQSFEIVTGREHSRTVWCLIDHQTTCEDCGEKCNVCGESCPNVCPGGRC